MPIMTSGLSLARLKIIAAAIASWLLLLSTSAFASKEITGVWLNDTGQGAIDHELGQFVRRQVAEEVADPVALQFGADRPVAERRRALGAVEEQHVRETVDRHPDVRVDAS